MNSINIEDIYTMFINNESLNISDIGDDSGEEIIAIKEIITDNERGDYYALTKHCEIYKIDYLYYYEVCNIIFDNGLISDNNNIYTVGETFEPFINIKKIISPSGTIGANINYIDVYDMDKYAGEIIKNHPFYTDIT